MTEKPGDKGELEYRGPISESLPEDPEILEQYDVLGAISTQKDEQQRLIIKMIQEFQRKCPHERWKEVRSLVMGSFRGWRCTVCKAFKPIPKGWPWEICQECGTVMVYCYTYDEQRVNVYRCPKCQHEEEVT